MYFIKNLKSFHFYNDYWEHEIDFRIWDFINILSGTSNTHRLHTIHPGTFTAYWAYTLRHCTYSRLSAAILNFFDKKEKLMFLKIHSFCQQFFPIKKTGEALCQDYQSLFC